MFITSSLPAISRSRPKNGMCLSFGSAGAANPANPGIEQNISRVASPPDLGRCAHANLSPITTLPTLDSRALSRPPLKFDPYEHDPSRWGVSMAQVTEIMLACLDVAEVKSVAEVGAFAGDLTRVLVSWAADSGARIQAIDPAPQPGLEL